MHRVVSSRCLLAVLLLVPAACQRDAPPGGGPRDGAPGGGPRGGPPGAFATTGSGGATVPVEVTPVARRTIAEYLETNGTLEAEQEVDVVARTVGPIVELAVEEGMEVREGQLLARIDDRDLASQATLARIDRDDARLAFDRAEASFAAGILAQETLDQTRSRLASTEAQLANAELQLAYTRIAAPFDGLIVKRYVKQAQFVGNGTPVFRLSDFVPLLCPIRVPEKDLSRLRRGQPAYLLVEAFPGRKFPAAVLRVSPVVDAVNGTIEVTLEVDGQRALRPGMFASVFLEVGRREDALVIPRTALVLDGIGDAVFIRAGEVAARREVRLGIREADVLEVVAGLSPGDEVIVLGQDGLSDGTPISVRATNALDEDGPPATSWRPPAGGERAGPPPARPADPGGPGSSAGPRGPWGPGGPGGPGGRPDPRTMTPEQLEGLKERMRQRGLSEAEIEQRLEQMRRGGPPGRPPSWPEAAP